MNISKTSWHYRLNGFMGTEVHRDLEYGDKVTLCRYFWGTVGGCLLLMLAALVMLSMGVVVLNTTAAFILGAIFYYFDAPLVDYELGLYTIFACGAFVWWVAWSAGQLKWFPDYITKYFKSESDKPNAPKEPSIVAEYYKAYKSKVCPYLSLKEDK
jgi:hypothetical protein